MREFGRFAGGVSLGVVEAVKSDPDVFMLAVAGVLGGRKMVSRAILAYVAIRRVDKIAWHFSQIMSADRTREEPT